MLTAHMLAGAAERVVIACVHELLACQRLGLCPVLVLADVLLSVLPVKLHVQATLQEQQLGTAKTETCMQLCMGASLQMSLPGRLSTSAYSASLCSRLKQALEVQTRQATTAIPTWLSSS